VNPSLQFPVGALRPFLLQYLPDVQGLQSDADFMPCTSLNVPFGHGNIS